MVRDGVEHRDAVDDAHADGPFDGSEAGQRHRRCPLARLPPTALSLALGVARGFRDALARCRCLPSTRERPCFTKVPTTPEWGSVAMQMSA